MNIKSTKDYYQFKTIQGNREINLAHLNKLKKAIQKNNMLESFPIVVNRKFEIIDGQHRLAAARELGLTIYYIENAEANLSEIQLTQSNLRNWTTMDFLHSYLELKFPHYIVLNNFMKKYDLQLAISLKLLSPNIRRSEYIELFRDGLFTVTNRDNAEILADRLLELRPYSIGKITRSRDFMGALIELYKKVKHEDLLHKLQVSGVKLESKSSLREYMRLFEDILNFARKDGTIVRLY